MQASNIFVDTDQNLFNFHIYPIGFFERMGRLPISIKVIFKVLRDFYRVKYSNLIIRPRLTSRNSGVKILSFSFL